MDLRSRELGGLSQKQFDKKYPILKCWGCYMYIDPDEREIYYIGSASREKELPFKARFKEELRLPTTTFCNELRNLGVNIETLSIKVALINLVIDNSRKINEVNVVKQIEMPLICVTGPLYDPHGPVYAKRDVIIKNTGNHQPLPKFLRMRQRQQCRKYML